MAILVPSDRTLAQSPGAFVGAIEDLPLMPGLVEDAGSGVVFDTAAGRIAEAFASGPVSKDAVLDFYRQTLPQLGWRALGGGVFSREREVLKVEFPGPGGTGSSLTVRFALSPAAP